MKLSFDSVIPLPGIYSKNHKTRKTPVLRKLHNTEERNQGRHKQMETCTVFMDQKN